MSEHNRFPRQKISARLSVHFQALPRVLGKIALLGLLSILGLFSMLGTVGCAPGGLSKKAYLELPLWQKEEQALDIMRNTAALKSQAEFEEALSTAAGLFKELDAELALLDIRSEKLKKLNDIQRRLCRIYVDTAAEYLATKDSSVLASLAQADALFLEFIEASGK